MTYRHNRPQTQEINFGAADEVQKTQQQQQQPGDTISNADGFSTAGVSSISTPTLALPQLNAEVSGTLAQLLSTICAIEEVQRNAEVAEAESLEVQTGSLTNSMMDTAQLTLNVTCQEIQNTMYQLEIQKVSNVMTIVMDVIAIAIAIAMLVAAVFSGGTTAAIAAAAIAFVATGTMCGISIATVVSGTSPFAQGSALYDSAYNASYASASANEDDDIADKMSSDSSLSYSQAKSLVEGGYRESASASASSVCEGWGIGVMVFLAICTLGSGVAGAASLGSTAMSTTATALMVTSSVLMTASQIMGSLASFNILANAMNAASGGELYEGTSAQKQELNQQLTDTVQDLAIAAAAVAVTAMVVGIAGGAQGEGSESISTSTDDVSTTPPPTLKPSVSSSTDDDISITSPSAKKSMATSTTELIDDSSVTSDTRGVDPATGKPLATTTIDPVDPSSAPPTTDTVTTAQPTDPSSSSSSEEDTEDEEEPTTKATSSSRSATDDITDGGNSTAEDTSAEVDEAQKRKKAVDIGIGDDKEDIADEVAGVLTGGVTDTTSTTPSAPSSRFEDSVDDTMDSLSKPPATTRATIEEEDEAYWGDTDEDDLGFSSDEDDDDMPVLRRTQDGDVDTVAGATQRDTSAPPPDDTVNTELPGGTAQRTTSTTSSNNTGDTPGDGTGGYTSDTRTALDSDSEEEAATLTSRSRSSTVDTVASDSDSDTVDLAIEDSSSSSSDSESDDDSDDGSTASSSSSSSKKSNLKNLNQEQEKPKTTMQQVGRKIRLGAMFISGISGVAVGSAEAGMSAKQSDLLKETASYQEITSDATAYSTFTSTMLGVIEDRYSSESDGKTGSCGPLNLFSNLMDKLSTAANVAVKNQQR